MGLGQAMSAHNAISIAADRKSAVSCGSDGWRPSPAGSADLTPLMPLRLLRAITRI